MRKGAISSEHLNQSPEEVVPVSQDGVLFVLFLEVSGLLPALSFQIRTEGKRTDRIHTPLKVTVPKPFCMHSPQLYLKGVGRGFQHH